MDTEIILRKEAIAKRLKTYFTGKPCKHGHIAKRFTLSGTCYECIHNNVKNEREIVKKLFAEIE